MSALYIARHQETEANREELVLGASDSPLTDEGRKGALQLSRMLRGRGIALIISSPLRRAEATARVIAEICGAPFSIDGDYGELSCGSWEGRPRREILPAGGPLRSAWADAPPGGESFEDAAGRIARVLERALFYRKRHTVLMVGHGAANQLLLALFMGLDRDPHRFPLQPSSLVYFFEGFSPLKAKWLDAGGASGEGLVVPQ
ncbi:MAG: histidine phosphatase family protein [Candidatus Eremiobacteraeota bacterium]|nr:histidine phosphatase family protein [Candidatus Eremiobacteraeota bacterium]